MTPYKLTTTSPLKFRIEPLSPEAFASFGTVIQNTPARQTSAVPANQGTASKIPSISPLTNNYSTAPSQNPGKPAVSMFICSPRQLRPDPTTTTTTTTKSNKPQQLFDVTILERHPFTTQTFTPLALDAAPNAATSYLVIVCPSVSKSASPNPTSNSWTQEFNASEAHDTSKDKTPSNPPDLHNLRAFKAAGNQAVTYAPGTWHAPMVVLGPQSVEFVVTQFANGVADEDCEEVEILPASASGSASGSEDGENDDDDNNGSEKGIVVIVEEANASEVTTSSAVDMLGEWKEKAKM